MDAPSSHILLGSEIERCNFIASRLSLPEWDICCMRRAIALGELGKETAAPNPWVGCVITDRNNNIIGEGYHRKAGTPHAEICAINSVESNLRSAALRNRVEFCHSHLEDVLRNATCYTTLEPCSHTGRTPPCDKKLISFQFGRVVVAIVDPDDKVAGTGIQHLVDAGIRVDSGICKDEAEISLCSYLKHRRTGMPLVVLKIASSLDGKIALKSDVGLNLPSLVSNEQSRIDMHKRWRASSQAIIIGAGTAEADDPELTTRHWYDHVDRNLVQSALRVVLGSASREFTCTKKLADSALAPTLVISNTTSLNRDSDPNHGGYQVLNPTMVGATADHPRPDFELVLKYLGARGILQVLVEGGATLTTSLLDTGLVDRFVVYMAPTILGNSGVEWCGAQGVSGFDDHYALHKTIIFGNDICIEYAKKDDLD